MLTDLEIRQLEMMAKDCPDPLLVSRAASELRRQLKSPAKTQKSNTGVPWLDEEPALRIDLDGIEVWDAMRDLAKSLTPFCSVDSSRPAIQCIQITKAVDGGSIWVATDGHRLVRLHSDLRWESSHSGYINPRDLYRIEGEVVGFKWWLDDGDAYGRSSRKVAGMGEEPIWDFRGSTYQYPDVNRIRTVGLKPIVQVAHLAEALKALDNQIKQHNDQVKRKVKEGDLIQMGGSGMYLLSNGELREKASNFAAPCEGLTTEVVLGINPAYLRDMIPLFPDATLCGTGSAMDMLVFSKDPNLMMWDLGSTPLLSGAVLMPMRV